MTNFSGNKTRYLSDRREYSQSNVVTFRKCGRYAIPSWNQFRCLEGKDCMDSNHSDSEMNFKFILYTLLLRNDHDRQKSRNLLPPLNLISFKNHEYSKKSVQKQLKLVKNVEVCECNIHERQRRICLWLFANVATIFTNALMTGKDVSRKPKQYKMDSYSSIVSTRRN